MQCGGDMPRKSVFKSLKNQMGLTILESDPLRGNLAIKERFQAVTENCKVLVTGYDIKTDFDVPYPSK